MSDRRIVVVLLAMVATLAGGFFACFERYDEVVDRGPGPRARRNPYLAAELYLDRVLGRRVVSHASWTGLGDPDALPAAATLLVTDERLILSSTQLDRLLDWVQVGGTLIVGAAPTWADERETLLLARFGLSHRGLERAEAAEHDGEAGDAEESRPVSEALREYNEELAARREREKGKGQSEGRAAEEAGEAGREEVSIPAEEITRLRSHLGQFHEILEHEQFAGRKLEFLSQEMYREANTIGSKASDVAISKHVVELKSQVERVREIVQNVE